MLVYLIGNYSYLTLAFARQLLTTSLVCLALVLLLTWLWRRHSPRLLFGVWALMGLTLLVPAAYLVAPSLHHVPLLGDWHAALSNNLSWLPGHPCDTPLYQRISDVLFSDTPLLNGRVLLLAAWGLGSLILMLRFAARRLRFRAVVFRALPLNDPAVLMRVETWRKRYGISRRVWVRSSDECSGAFTLGTLWPIVFLPRQLLQRLHRDDLDAVIGHELAHVKRCDDFWFVVIRCVHSLFFFTPIAWLAGRALARLREQCCDAMAVRAGNLAPRQYLDSLLKVLELQAKAPPPAGLSFVTVHSSLRERAQRLLVQPVRTRHSYWLLALLLVVATIVLTTPRYDAHLMPEATTRHLFGDLRLLPPIAGARVSREFAGDTPILACRLPNLRDLGRHPALDFAPLASREVVASLAGEVIDVADSGSPIVRKIVHIEHTSGLVATYAHVGEALVKTGQRVAPGQPIARMPEDSNAYLHFELHYRNQIVNPNLLLR